MIDREKIRTKREAAARTWRLAPEFSCDKDRARAFRFAAELKAQAEALERGLPSGTGTEGHRSRVRPDRQGLPQAEGDNELR